MANKFKVISYTLAAIAGVCFVQGLAILTHEGGDNHGQSEEIYNVSRAHVEC